MCNSTKKYLFGEYRAKNEEYSVGIALKFEGGIPMLFSYGYLMVDYPDTYQDYVDKEYGLNILNKYIKFVEEYEGDSFELLNIVFGIENTLKKYDCNTKIYEKYCTTIDIIKNKFSNLQLIKYILLNLFDLISKKLNSEICFIY